MKKLILLVLIVAVSFSKIIAQDTVRRSERTTKAYMEIMCLPPLHLTLGIGLIPGQKSEHVLSANASFLGYVLTGAVRYNFNYYVLKRKKLKMYVPFWAGVRGGWIYGDENSYVFMLYSVGSGIGIQLKTFKRQFLKLELGLGAALSTSSDYYYRKPFFKHPFKVDNPYPVIPAARLSIRYAIPIVSKP